MALRRPADPAAGVPRLPGWHALFAVWAAIAIGIGVIVVWAEARSPHTPTTVVLVEQVQVGSDDVPDGAATASPPDTPAEPPPASDPPPVSLAQPEPAVPSPEPMAEPAAPPAAAPPEPSPPAIAQPSVQEPPAAVATRSEPSAAPEPVAPVAVVPPAPPAEPRPDPQVQAAVVLPPVAPPPAISPPPATEPPLATPDPGLLEPSRHGMLPRRAPDGRMPYQAYAQPYRRSDYRPRIGLIVADSGAFEAYSDDMLRRLPAQVAIAVSPYSPYGEAMVRRARERGMEVLVSLPLEPAGFPLNDPGHRALLTARSAAENADNLDWVLSRFRGYVGAIGALGPMRGERFALQPDQLRRVHDSLRARGLLYIDPRPGTPTTERVWGRTVDIILDEPPTRIEIERRLSELDIIARLRGSAVAYAGTLSPSLVDRLTAWWAGLEARGLLLAPISSLLRVRQPVEPQAENAIPAQR